MGLVGNYAIWNNKGGVGKSTLTFHLASMYAHQNPEQKVLVIDLCPQSNSSMMLLGGGEDGEKLTLDQCQLPLPKTVVGYLGQVITAGPGAALPDPYDFLIQPNEHNEHMPENLWLLCGDGNLEPMAPAISEQAGARALTPASNPWLWIHLIFRRFIENFVQASDEDVMVFIDTNPSFSVYTELAISAADRLIVPVNADDSSRVATNAMFILLHGQTPPHPIYGTWTYAAKAIEVGIQIPKVHLIVGNRLTSYEGVAAAFEALSGATADTLFAAFQRHPAYFTARPRPPKSVTTFRKEYSIPLRDFNTAGIVSAHLGRPMNVFPRGLYQVHGRDVSVDARQIKEAREAIEEVIALL